MGKKIAGIIASYVVMLLAMFFIIVLLWRYQEFLGKAITVLLGGCVGIVMLFMLYLMISQVIRTLRGRDSDENSLSERAIARFLSSESAQRRKQTAKAAQEAEQNDVPDLDNSVRRGFRRQKFQTQPLRTQSEFEAQRTAQAAAARRQREEAERSRIAAEEEKARRMQDMHERNLRRAAETSDDSERRMVLAEAEVLSRAARETSERIQQEEKAHKKQVRAEMAREQAEQAAAAVRKMDAIESSRRQAEALAATRRRAAQQYMMEQTHAALPLDSAYSIDLDPMRLQQDAVGAPMQVASSFVPRATASPLIPGQQVQPLQTLEPSSGESIWDMMQVMQSASQLTRRPHERTASWSRMAPQSSTGPRRRSVGDTTSFTPGSKTRTARAVAATQQIALPQQNRKRTARQNTATFAPIRREDIEAAKAATASTPSASTTRQLQTRGRTTSIPTGSDATPASAPAAKKGKAATGKATRTTASTKDTKTNKAETGTKLARRTAAKSTKTTTRKNDGKKSTS